MLCTQLWIVPASLDHEKMDLLSQVSEILQNPNMLALLQQLSSPTCLLTPTHLLEPSTQLELTLLQRMNEIRSSANLNQQSRISGTVIQQKWTLSPPSSPYFGRSLMSQLLNLKRRQISTHISPKSSPSSPPSTNQEESLPQVSQTYNLQMILARLALKETQRTHTMMPNQNQMMMKTNLPGNKHFLKATCPGSQNPMNLPLTIVTPVARKPVGYSNPTIKTFPNPNFSSKLLQIHQLEFPLHNGNVSLEEMQLTSTKSSHPYTMSSLMKREQVTWETQKLCLEFLKARNRSPLLQNGCQHGEGL